MRLWIVCSVIWLVDPFWFQNLVCSFLNNLSYGSYLPLRSLFILFLTVLDNLTKGAQGVISLMENLCTVFSHSTYTWRNENAVPSNIPGPGQRLCVQTKHSLIYIQRDSNTSAIIEKEIQDESLSYVGLSKPTGNLTWSQIKPVKMSERQGFNNVCTNILAPLLVPSPAIFLGRMWAAKSQMEIALANPVIYPILLLPSWCGEHLSGLTSALQCKID